MSASLPSTPALPVPSLPSRDELVARLVDHREIVQRVHDLGLGLDLGEPDRYRNCFADEVEVCNPTFAGDASVRRYSGDEWAASVSATQGRFTARVHTLTSPVVEIDGDGASVVVLQQATFVLAESDNVRHSYQVAGPLRLGFVRTAAGWRVCRLAFEVTWSEGDPTIYATARERGQT